MIVTLWACCALLAALAWLGPSAVARAETNVLFIVDASGSMKKAVEGEPRMTAAKRVLAEALAAMPADARLGMLVHGHRKAKDCTSWSRRSARRTPRPLPAGCRS